MVILTKQFSVNLEASRCGLGAGNKTMRLSRLPLVFALVTALFVFSAANASAAANAKLSIPPNISALLDTHCFSCHDSGTKKGNVQLDNLEQLDLPQRLDLLNDVQEQIFLGSMPKKDKLPSGDSEVLLKWVGTKLAEHKASTLEDKLRYYRYANAINHEKLFSGEIKEMPFTPARRWRINSYIYTNIILGMYNTSLGDPENPGNPGKKSNVKPVEKKERELPAGYVQPFSRPAESGVKYYDTEVVSGSEFLTLLANAKYTVNRQLIGVIEKTEGYVAPPARTSKANIVFRPGKTDSIFEKVVLSKGTPADADLQSAITRQFQLALRRSPSPEEMTEYLQFMKEAIKTSGLLPALEKMMVAVLMETDFLYRSELGDGQRDAYGRAKLTAREASYALAYALTDEPPDGALVQAAKSGMLTTKEDYRREVLRMLDDDNLRKPRILRFFQDYFGYYNVYNIFKDDNRFGSAFNPHRASSRTMQWGVPGKVTKEADALVRSILKEDKDVLKKLLTTDKYFVHHSGDNEEMVNKATQFEEALKAIRAVWAQSKDNGQQLKHTGAGVEGVDPKTVRNILDGFNPEVPDRKLMAPVADGRPHAVSMYNIDSKTWSYPAVQPIKLENRMGMLTHPAWLISFSGNTETDPIRRGKWIQEKLLAGIVPDVPITVEAKVPEAHDKTLRQRISSVTEQKNCWSCHQKMNPLGYPFESFDDFGRFRTVEMLEHPENILKTEKVKNPDGGRAMMTVNTYKTLPVANAGALAGTGDKSLDGEVKDAYDLIQRLAKSDRVRQSFVRNVFRYYMGRNEMYSDSKTLIEADKAYVESGGSFKALIVSLLTSDSFIYRK